MTYANNYLLPDGADDNFDIPLGTNFVGDFALVMDSGVIFGSIDTGATDGWAYTKDALYIPDGDMYALIVVDRAMSSSERAQIVSTFSAGVTRVPTTALTAFRGRSDLTEIDLEYIDFGQVTDARFTFVRCSGLTTPPDVSGWTQVTNANAAFHNCTGLTTAPDLRSWNPTILADAVNMMLNVPLAAFGQAEYDELLIAWDAAWDLTTVNPLDIHFGSAPYTLGGAAEAARDKLVAAGWTITDGGGV